VPEVRVDEFAAGWPDDATTLLDVREPHEFGLAAVAGALHIPMGDIVGRLNELDRDKTIVVMCHSGVRSMAVARYLQGEGFARVFNLAGGIDAWSREVDPTVPTY
jgi:rhodanese-related sulfurtransferase